MLLKDYRRVEMLVQMGNPDIILDAELKRNIEAIIKSGWVSIGEWVEALESRFRELTGCKHAIATNSATSGLIIAIKAAGWKHRVVHMPAFTWPSTLYAVECNSNYRWLHDINKETFLIDFKTEDEYSEDCIIPVDIFGSQSEKPMDFSKDRVIIDAAHGFGLPKLGKRGIAEVVSLSFTKSVTGMEGGIILTDDDNLAETATELRRLSARMGEINACIAMQSIDGYEERKKVTKWVIGAYLVNIDVPVYCQDLKGGGIPSVFSLLFKETVTRNAVMKALARNGVETKVYYDPLINGHVNTDYVYNHILSLPIHEGVVDHVFDIVDIINSSAETTPAKCYLTGGNNV
jgi:dTDP-4-amino-4,6-dideoxygalactose transaminase